MDTDIIKRRESLLEAARRIESMPTDCKHTQDHNYDRARSLRRRAENLKQTCDDSNKNAIN